MAWSGNGSAASSGGRGEERGYRHFATAAQVVIFVGALLGECEPRVRRVGAAREGGELGFGKALRPGHWKLLLERARLLTRGLVVNVSSSCG